MGRPPLAVGTYGAIKVRRDGDRWKARAYVRDADGRRREVARWAQTKAAAEAALKLAMTNRDGGRSLELDGDARLEQLAERFLTDVDESEKAPNTKRLYRSSWTTNLAPALGGLRLREINVPRADRALQAIAAHSGNSAAKTARSVLSGMLGLAVRQGAIDTNPVRDTSAISIKTKSPRALTIDEEYRVRDVPRTMQRAIDLDVPDFIDWMLGTGMRIGEACAIRYGLNDKGEPLLDLDAGTVEVNATVIRVRGHGLALQERPKSGAGHRVLAVPEDLVLMLRRRQDELRLTPPEKILVVEADGRTLRYDRGDGLVFLSPRGRLRDPRNTDRALDEVLGEIDAYRDEDDEMVRPFGWVTSHVFRKTAATRLDEGGMSARQIADVLGHKKPSMTQDVYMGRKVVSSAAASLLARPANGRHAE